MKPLPILFTLLFGCRLTSFCAEPVPGNIRIEMQVVVIPEALGVPLVAELLDEQKIEPANLKIQQWLANGTAKLIAWPIITTVSGNKAIVEAVDEIRYATEYSPPKASFTPNPSAEEPAKGDAKSEVKVDLTVFNAYPEAFETRNAGVTLEVQPTVSADYRTIELELIPQHVQLVGFHKVTVENSDTKDKVIVEQPQFHTAKTSTAVTLRNGQRVLMGVFRVSEPANHLEFFILKAEAKKVE